MSLHRAFHRVLVFGAALLLSAGCAGTTTALAPVGGANVPRMEKAQVQLPSASITEYSLPASWANNPFAIAKGANGHIWFSYLYANQIGEIATGGNGRNFAIPFGRSPANVRGMALGPDGKIWFTDQSQNAIVSVTTDGTFAEHPLPNADSQPLAITKGPDGNLWFTERAGRVGKITTSGSITEYSVPRDNESRPGGITAGPDGNVWFTMGQEIDKITPSGAIHEYGPHDPYCSPCEPTAIVAGTDGNLWYTDSAGNLIGRMTTRGTATFYRLPSFGGPTDIAVGPGGKMWFTEPASEKIGSITTNGFIQEYPTPTPGAFPLMITRGPFGKLWFTELFGNKIGKVTP